VNLVNKKREEEEKGKNVCDVSENCHRHILHPFEEKSISFVYVDIHTSKRDKF